MTDYQLIYDRFDNKIKDYELDSIFNTNISNYEDVLLRYLKTARTNFKQFKNNNKRLSSYIDDTLSCFTVVLEEDEQEILAMLMVSSWMDKEINSITSLRGSLNDAEYKRISEKSQMDLKLNAKNQLLGEINNKINEYTLYKEFMDE